MVLFIEFSTDRLLFLPGEWKQWLSQLYFVFYMTFVTAILWKLNDFGLEWYQQKNLGEQKGAHTRVMLHIVRDVLRTLLVLLSITLVLNNYGMNITALIAILGIGGLVLTLATQDTLSDVISGFIILFNQPFRVGDRILLDNLGVWGDVISIGSRTTAIRTLNNSLMIVPNSKISKKEVVNYTYPDPR